MQVIPICRRMVGGEGTWKGAVGEASWARDEQEGQSCYNTRRNEGEGRPTDFGAAPPGRSLSRGRYSRSVAGAGFRVRQTHCSTLRWRRPTPDTPMTRINMRLFPLRQQKQREQSIIADAIPYEPQGLPRHRGLHAQSLSLFIR